MPPCFRQAVKRWDSELRGDELNGPIDIDRAGWGLRRRPSSAAWVSPDSHAGMRDSGDDSESDYFLDFLPAWYFSFGYCWTCSECSVYGVSVSRSRFTEAPKPAIVSAGSDAPTAQPSPLSQK